MWKHLRACVCRALLLVPFSQLHALADKNTPQWDTQETHQLNWPISSAIWSCGQTAEHSHFVWSFHTGWPTSAPTHCCPYSLFRKQRPSLQTIPIAVLTACSGNRGLPCKPYPLLSLQPDQETEAFLANHTHCCPYSLIRKQRPSLQTIPIAVLTAWSGNRGLPCKPYPLLSLQLDQETEAFLANHTHCCPYSLIRKQRPSWQTIPIAVLTAWPVNRSLPCISKFLWLVLSKLYTYQYYWCFISSFTCQIQKHASVLDHLYHPGMTCMTDRVSQTNLTDCHKFATLNFCFSVHNIHKHTSTWTHTHTHPLSLSSSAY